MRPEQTAVFSDLDGTLFNAQGLISRENREAIRAYIDAGGRFAVATGREPQNAWMFLGELPQNAPAVVVNGCALYDFSTGEYLRRWFLDRGRLDPFLRALLADFPSLELQAYTDEGIRYCTPEQTAHPQLLAMHRPCIFTTLDALPDAAFFKCFLFVPAAEDERLMARLRAGEEEGLFRHVPGTTDVGGPISYHELLPRDVSKGTALRALRELPEFRERTILAAGDFWNDYELLEEADVAVAPANAPAGIQAICDYVTVTNNEHVLAHLLSDILPAL